MPIESHEHYMQEALRLAQMAHEEGEVPAGCLIVDAYPIKRTDSPILSRAYNQVEQLHDPTAHAEMLAIADAAEAIGDWRLTNCVLYVTKEPCAMCAGAIVLARIPIVVYGVSDPKRGGDTVFNILTHPDLNHRCEIITGVLENECRQYLQSFFRNRRK